MPHIVVLRGYSRYYYWQAWGPHGMQGVNPGSAKSKTNDLLFVLLLCPFGCGVLILAYSMA